MQSIKSCIVCGKVLEYGVYYNARKYCGIKCKRAYENINRKPITEEERKLRNEKAKASAAKYRQTEKYREWLERSRELRKQLKEKYRRQKGAIPRAKIEQNIVAKKKTKEAIEQAKALLHDAHVKAMYGLSDADMFRWRYRNDPEFNIKQRIKTQIKKRLEQFPRLGDLMRAAINRNGNSNQVQHVCGYSIEQLRDHIERQFTKGMTWERFMAGDIHIDHIIPKSSFNLLDISDVRACWCLSNLRPMWAKDNIQKKNKIMCLI